MFRPERIDLNLSPVKPSEWNFYLNYTKNTQQTYLQKKKWKPLKSAQENLKNKVNANV